MISLSEHWGQIAFSTSDISTRTTYEAWWETVWVSQSGYFFLIEKKVLKIILINKVKRKCLYRQKNKYSKVQTYKNVEVEVEEKHTDQLVMDYRKILSCCQLVTGESTRYTKITVVPLIRGFRLPDFSYLWSTAVWKYRMENSRGKQLISFKLHAAVPSGTTKSHDVSS